jgi:hypothetical protein
MAELEEGGLVGSWDLSSLIGYLVQYEQLWVVDWWWMVAVEEPQEVVILLGS